MILSDVAFRDIDPVCINPARTTAKSREQQIGILQEFVRAAGKPVDYYEISEHCGLEIGYDLSVKGRKYANPHRAQSLVLTLIKKHPDEFEIVRLPFRDGRGTLHFRPHVRVNSNWTEPPKPEMPNGMIKTDSDFAKEIGFTSDKFTNYSYLWGFPAENTLYISMIASNKKGAFRAMINELEKRNIIFRIPVPLGRM